VTMALLNKHYSGHHKATEVEEDKEHMEERSRQRNVDNRLQVQLEEDGSSSKQQSWMIETRVVCGLCSTGIDKA